MKKKKMSKRNQKTRQNHHQIVFFSLLGGFFCCYGWFRLSLSLASSSFPEPLWDCDKGGSASEKNR
jgi:hypothetical protein